MSEPRFRESPDRELSVEECDRRMRERIEQAIESTGECPRWASFALPFNADNELLLAERLLPPAAGLFSAVGGKDSKEDEEPSPLLWSLRRREGIAQRSQGQATIMREVCNELYSIDESEEGRFRQSRHGGEDPEFEVLIYDVQTNIYCKFFKVILPERELHPDQKQLGKVLAFSKIAIEKINPLTQLALYATDFIDRMPDDIDYGQLGHVCIPGAGGPQTLKEAMENKDTIYPPYGWIKTSINPQPAFFLDYKRKL